MILLMMGGLIVLMATGIPVSFALCLIATIGFMVDVGPEVVWLSLSAISQRMTFSLMNFLLLSIPFFILSAKLMNSAGITSRIFSFANSTVGSFPGGLAHANILASLIFSGMSGTAVSDAAGLGRIELKSMVDHGYDTEISVGVTAASSIIGPIFPPSVPMVVYSLVSGASVGQLFLGGVLPGILMTAVLMVLVTYIAKRRNFFCYDRSSLRKIVQEARKVFLPLMTPVILLSGIWGGFFTPTEAAVVAFTYASLLSYLVYRETGLKNLITVFVETGRETASIGFLISASAYYGFILSRSGVTNQIAATLMGISGSAIIAMLIVNLFLLLIGCFMEPTSAILIMGPILMPLIARYGIDPVHFGIIMVLNLMIGLLTPPFGVVLFIMQDMSGLSFGRVLRGAFIFITPLIVALGLIIVFPDIVLLLPRLLRG